MLQKNFILRMKTPHNAVSRP